MATQGRHAPGPASTTPSPTVMRSLSPEGGECVHCGSLESLCEGCGTRRCLACDPYLSDDCRWMV